MKPSPQSLLRMAFLSRVVKKECRHLEVTDQRLFGAGGFDLDVARRLDSDDDLSERVEAFVGRFARLQDTLGDKLLPELLRTLGERTGAMIDNLDLAERLDLLGSSDHWMVMRNLRNQMVHEYVEDLAVLTDALLNAHGFVPELILTAKKMLREIERRGWL